MGYDNYKKRKMIYSVIPLQKILKNAKCKWQKTFGPCAKLEAAAHRVISQGACLSISESI